MILIRWNVESLRGWEKRSTPSQDAQRPDFLPAQPWRAGTRPLPSKAAASEEAMRTLFGTGSLGAKRELRWRTLSASC